METLESLKAVDDFIEILKNLEGLCNLNDLSQYEIYDLATKIQKNALRAEYNAMYASANVIRTGELVPSALEKIAMELEKLSNK
jgi:bacterioferritin (cytochrome b1)